MIENGLEGSSKTSSGFGRREYGPVELGLKTRVIVKMIGAGTPVKACSP
jgi:hypothetical protein